MEDLDKTSDFLFYNSEDGSIKVQVVVGQDTVWTTQKGMAEIFNVEVPAISKHTSNIISEGELTEATVSKMETVQIEGGREVKRTIEFYNLDMIIAVGYRVNSYNATKFRIWATKVLREYLIKGFALDDERLKQGNNLFNKDFFNELLDRIREIRSSEKMFYEKVRELYATSVDYDGKAPETITFFQTVQNKLEYAITGKTAAELIKGRANAGLPHMNLKSWKNAKKAGAIQKADVTVAKNYLEEPELRELNGIVTMFLDYAENQAKRNRLMKMQNWIDRLDAFLRFNEYQVLDNAGSVRKDVADKFAQGEYAKYKVIQDDTYQSEDFSKLLETIRTSGKLQSAKEDGDAGEKKSEFDKQLIGLLKVPPPKKQK